MVSSAMSVRNHTKAQNIENNLHGELNLNSLKRNSITCEIYRFEEVVNRSEGPE